MKIYITYGTVDYLTSLVRKHPEQVLRLMANNDTGILFHETNEKSFFSQPKAYEVVESSGELQNGAFAVCNHIPVSDEGQLLFEKQFSNRKHILENEPGFSSSRVLRPAKGDTYIILSFWDNEQYFNAWHESKNYDNVFENSKSKAAIGQPLASPTYSTKYSAVDIED